jgi:hypothetical protein
VCDANNSRVLSWPSAAQFADGQAADLVIGQPDFTSSDPADLDFGGQGPNAQNFDIPMAVAVDDNGVLYVADSYSYRILIFQAPFTNGMSASRVIGQPNFTTDAEPLAASASNLFVPRGLTFGGDGTLYVADGGQNRVLAFRNPLAGDTVADKVFGQPNFTSDAPNNGGVNASSLDGPTYIALDRSGTLYVADTNNNRVLAFANPMTSDSAADRVFGQPNFTSNDPNHGGLSASSLNIPLGLAFDPAGSLYVADGDNHRVLAYTNPANGDTKADAVFGQGGSFTSNTPNLAGPSAASLNVPIDAAFDRNGNLTIVDFENHRVLAYNRPAGNLRVYLPLIRR